MRLGATMEIKLVIGDPKSKKSYQATILAADAEKLAGKKIGDKLHGELVNLPGYELEITGGSDNAGFPMRRDIHGGRRARVLLTEGIGFSNIKIRKKTKKKKGELKIKYKIKGRRKRRTIRGNTISVDTAQVNTKLVKEGEEAISKLLGLEQPEVPKEEVKAEARE